MLEDFRQGFLEALEELDLWEKLFLGRGSFQELDRWNKTFMEERRFPGRE